MKFEFSEVNYFANSLQVDHVFTVRNLQDIRKSIDKTMYMPNHTN